MATKSAPRPAPALVRRAPVPMTVGVLSNYLLRVTCWERLVAILLSLSVTVLGRGQINKM